LVNLSNDDHPQYLNNTRGDVRYNTKDELSGLTSPDNLVLTGVTYSIIKTLGIHNYFCNTSFNSINVYLPTAIANKAVLNIKKIASANSVIVNCSGIQTIEGASTAIWTENNESITIVSDGNNWRIV
jgi:hypothetical protein